MIDLNKLKNVRRIVTHANCSDGVASALVLHAAIPEADVLFVTYGTKAYTSLEPEPGTLFCDIVPYVPQVKSGEGLVYDPEILQSWVQADTLVLDHHKGAKGLVDAFGRNGVFADEKQNPGVSGALLAYQAVWELCPDEYQRVLMRLADLAGIYDTWQKDHPDWEQARAQAEALLAWPIEQWLSTSPSGWEAMLALGPVLVARQDALVAKAVKTAYRFKQGDVRVVMLQDPESKIVNDANTLCSEEADLVVGFNLSCPDANNVPHVKFSCRSQGFDCCRFAKQFGGGGHTRAAGSVVVVQEFESVYLQFKKMLALYVQASS